MVSLTLALLLAQSTPAAEPVALPADAPTAEAAPELVPTDVPPTVKRPEVPADRPIRRKIFTSLGGVAGGAAGLGVALALTTCFGTCGPKLDASFANAALGSLLITGVGFAVHQAMGGKGEVILPLLAAMAVMFTSSLVGSLIDPRTPNAQLITTAIGAVPASVAVAFILDATASMDRSRNRW